MVNKFKRLNIVQIISLIIMIVAFILNIFKVNNMDNLFWIGLGLNMLGLLLFYNKWGQEGKTWFKNLDNNYSKNLTRKPSDIMLFMVVGYYLIICIEVINDYFVAGDIFKGNSILPLLALSIVYTYMCLNIVDKTSKEIKTLIMEYENKLNKKGKSKNGNK